MAFLVDCDYFGSYGRPSSAPVLESNFCPFTGPFARPEHGPPIVWLVLLQEEHLEFSAAPRTPPTQPCRYDTGIVQCQNVPLSEVFPQRFEHPMLQTPVVPAQYQQPGSLAASGWLLSDKLLGEVKIEIRGKHWRRIIKNLASKQPETRRAAGSKGGNQESIRRGDRLNVNVIVAGVDPSWRPL